MDGFYLNNDKHRKYLNKWYKDAIEIVPMDGYDHVHIDDIDKKLCSDSKLWFDSALYFYDVMYNNIIDKSIYNCHLEIQLKYGRKKTDKQNINNITVAYIKRKIDDIISPSIYIFKKNDTNYDLKLLQTHYLEKLSKQLSMKVYFTESENYPKEFDRAIFITF